MSKIWLDITNTPQVHFLSAIYRSLERRGDFNCIITAREFSETAKLLEKQNEFPFEVIGEHYGRSYIKKVFGLAKRALSVFNSDIRSEEHTSELQSRGHLVCRLLLEKKKKPIYRTQQ